MSNDDLKLHAMVLALRATVQATMVHLAAKDPVLRGKIEIDAGEYINKTVGEGTPLHQEALTALRMSIFNFR
ncbi:MULTISPECIES: hypothetical protein [Methylobacterium]|uniref:hypothetical protein n=1 Tax=Methylobacterium TaxID=407 RepID=UPI0013EAC03D|nr:hypothetical protein [Methylobacterium sp. DB0501]NGM33853.1 hypothetical protein [Methylobacterium sp. DB0501]